MNRKQIIVLHVLALCLQLKADTTLLESAVTKPSKPAPAKPQAKPESPSPITVPYNAQHYFSYLIRGKPKPITANVAPMVTVTIVDKQGKKTMLESSKATIDAFFNTLEQAAYKIGKETHQVDVAYSHNGHEQHFSSSDEVPLTPEGIQLYFYAFRRASGYLGKTVKSPLIEKRTQQLNMLTYLTLNQTS